MEEDDIYEDEEVQEKGEDENIAVEQLYKGSKVNYQQKIMILYGNPQTWKKEDIIVTNLPHPRTKSSVKLMISNNVLLELNRFVDQPSSWFVDGEVQKDGSIYMATPVDPIFFLIDLLDQNRKKTDERAGLYCEFSQMLLDSNQAGFRHLLKLKGDINLSLICDVNSDLEEPLYRLNDEKVITWLCCKVERMKEALSATPELLASAAQASTFKSSLKAKPIKPEELLRGALGFVGEYVSPTIMTEVAAKFGIEGYGKLKEVPAVHDDDFRNSAAEKRKSSAVVKETVKKPKLTPGQAKLAKTNTKGMNKISSFFGGKQ